MRSYIDDNGNEIAQVVFIDNNGNIINEKDVEYIEESYIDKNGNKQYEKIPKIKKESLRRMQEEEYYMQYEGNLNVESSVDYNKKSN